MPNRDGTGPRNGQGPMSGKGLGPCGQQDKQQPGFFGKGQCRKDRGINGMCNGQGPRNRGNR